MAETQPMEQSKASSEAQQEKQGTQGVKLYPAKFHQLVPEAKYFSFLVQALPIVSMDRLRRISSGGKYANRCVIHPAAMVLFSRGLNLILARIILNSIFVYDSSSTLRSINRDICIGADEVFEMDPYLNKSTIARDYPLMKNLLYSLKASAMKEERGGERVSRSYDESNEVEKFKSKLLLHYVSKSELGSGCRSLVLSRYAKSLTTVHIREGLRLHVRFADVLRLPRVYALSQMPPRLTTEQLDVHQLSIIPCINWVQILVYNLPYKYEVMTHIRNGYLMRLVTEGWIKLQDTASTSQGSNPRGVLDFYNADSSTESRIGELECIIPTDSIEYSIYFLVDYWIRMSFFFHVTDFEICNKDRPQQEQEYTPQNFPMHVRPQLIDGISIRKLEEALLMRYNLPIPREYDNIPYIGEV
ncbi:hypothetical protein GL50803_0016089 [Giardia duodenalis]|uniref:Uncharacterized protein n=1 Tax=Giardia intestinalis (strain ATCC 50803 / WB clone C6) TaxID=184922 RepID=A8B3M6_GIAIC|nr:hypothetical protein GL50803_0016089 [Giardia intestinalis]KAE8303193.1 hypothetical protein GL50803_0016089 [Giardia intestinalis]|eukprot:XP_001710262.1 Hypothetical protein GL50803_16089 [Giardia lamblia ATCC 50803]